MSLPRRRWRWNCGQIKWARRSALVSGQSSQESISLGSKEGPRPRELIETKRLSLDEAIAAYNDRLAKEEEAAQVRAREVNPL
jgi:hypothetical protein